MDRRKVRPPKGAKQNLCGDKAYCGQHAQLAIKRRKMVPHIRKRGEEILARKKNSRHRNYRWIVEVDHSWFNRFRKLLVRYEKLAVTHEALVHLAAAIICFRKIKFQKNIIYG